MCFYVFGGDWLLPATVSWLCAITEMTLCLLPMSHALHQHNTRCPRVCAQVPHHLQAGEHQVSAEGVRGWLGR
jgi:hypothetical protein